MNAKLYAVLSIGIAALVIGLAPGFATEFRGGNSVFVAEGTIVDDELYASAGDITIDGKVSGDLLAFGGRISARGKIGQSASLAGGNVDVGGSVGNNLRAFGGQVSMSGTVADNASIFAGTVVLPKTARIGRDLHVAGGDVTIDAEVGRNLRVSGGQVRLDGEVGGNAEVNAGQLTVGPHAVVRGNLVYTSAQKASIAEGARITGKTIYRPTPEREKAPAWAWKVPLSLFGFLALFLAGVVMTAVAPRSIEAVADRVRSAPWLSILLGFVLLVVMPVAVMFLLITLIGMPLGLFLVAMYVIVIYLSRAFVGLAIGRWLFAKFGKPQVSPYLGLLVGLLILWLLLAIPYVGFLLHLVAILLGLGALAVQRYTWMRDLRREGKL